MIRHHDQKQLKEEFWGLFGCRDIVSIMGEKAGGRSKTESSYFRSHKKQKERTGHGGGYNLSKQGSVS